MAFIIIVTDSAILYHETKKSNYTTRDAHFFEQGSSVMATFLETKEM
jgi:hypothetical protein